ncbi:hypothetical protein GCM10009630_41170 [Kribbella jejuensis]|uniref:Uncharacterized protein n=1 Tax=Kribbella jejuensis TaxID=236068 RepID=A0A542E978_9ACTN|nr:hypothetical protein [Kribbella jejuensis]TQJ11836.1 hypothetical protein FB475_4759 [Kribbella jejuensis]
MDPQVWPGAQIVGRTTLRPDGAAVLGTVAQENDAWLELTPAEYQQVADQIPRAVVLQQA